MDSLETRCKVLGCTGVLYDLGATADVIPDPVEYRQTPPADPTESAWTRQQREAKEQHP